MRQKLFLLFLALFCVGTAYAATVRGTGRLTANGTGTAIVHCNAGNMTISASSGTLIIKDFGKDASITVTGRGVHTRNGHIHTYRGFNGTARITGTTFTIDIRGKNISLNAVGKGSAFLRGNGTYTIGDQSGSWTKRGINIEVN